MGRAARVAGSFAAAVAAAAPLALACGAAESPPSPDSTSWEALRRPLRIPADASECPKTHGRPANSLSTQFGYAFALGRGPVYPVPATDPIYEPNEPEGAIHAEPSSPAGWFGYKVLWIAPPHYQGRILVRGAHVGDGLELRFEADTDLLATELRLSAAHEETRWHNWPTTSKVREAGCYAYQIDTEDFTEVVVVRVQTH
jgi:hypothetical protein